MKKLFLLATIGAFILTSCGGSTSKETKTIVMSTDSPEGLKRTTLKGVQGLCEMCQDRIQKAAMSVENVESAVWNADSKDLVLTSSKTIDVAAVSKALAAVGHDTDMDKADNKVYSALPSCCQYR